MQQSCCPHVLSSCQRPVRTKRVVWLEYEIRAGVEGVHGVDGIHGGLRSERERGVRSTVHLDWRIQSPQSCPWTTSQKLVGPQGIEPEWTESSMLDEVREGPRSEQSEERRRRSAPCAIG